MNSRMDFLTNKNESMLNRILISDFQRRTNNELNDKQIDRLSKTIHHYIEEVNEKNSNGTIAELNKEVLGIVVKDFTSYLRRQTISSSSDTDTRMKEDLGSRFASIQNDRVEQKALMPPVPDFRIALEDENNVTAISLFEKAKKRREEEAKRINEGDRPSFSGTYLADLQSNNGIENANPTTAKPEAIRIKPVLAQDIIIPQDEILSYKENEYNLVVYSADRDWYNNTKENRYNFSITFNPANNGQGFKYSTSTNIKFHNIVRIEMVKAIVPAEGIDTILVNTSNTSFATEPYQETILSLPGIMIHIDELESNIHGTDDALDRAFATLQYDAQWLGNPANFPNSGYYAMIPKFLKCQRIYNPTPLATLSKLTIQLQKPNGSLINSSLDTLDIVNIFACNNTPTFSTSPSDYVGVVDDNTNSCYYYIQTKTYFNSCSFVSGDVIKIQGIDPTLISGNDAAKADFISYLQNNEGLTIIQTGIATSGGSSTLADIPNNVKYCNYIIVQSRFNDPTTGSTTIQPFGGTNVASQALEAALVNVIFTGARLINISKQTQLTFRIITRDMDSSTRIRPNNA